MEHLFQSVAMDNTEISIYIIFGGYVEKLCIVSHSAYKIKKHKQRFAASKNVKLPYVP
jgi:hypothetical protein